MVILEKKIFLDKQDTVAVAVDRIIDSSAGRVVVNIPRDSVIGSSSNNFRILKRESETAGKELMVESVDDHILELAALAKIKAVNPIFRIRERAVSDILPRSSTHPAIKNNKIIETIDQEKIVEVKHTPKLKKQKTESLPKIHFGEPKIHRPKRFFFLLIAVIIGSTLISGCYILAVYALPRATITVVLKKEIAVVDHLVQVDSRVSSVNLGNGKIVVPGELSIAKRNLELSFTAHGKEQISMKAGGKLTVYNAYSSELQTLVASTRFESPDGKTFRLEKRTTIPGAQIVSGRIEPSKIDVVVTADEAGDMYNLEPMKGWKIPGFKGTPKFEGFYAESVESMKGGFVGEKLVPTKEDIDIAKADMERKLKDAAAAQLLIVLSERLKLIDGAERFIMLKDDIQTDTKDATKFSMFGEGELRYIFFDDQVFQDAVVRKVQPENALDFSVKTRSLRYGGVSDVDFDRGVMTVGVTGSVVFVPPFDTESFKVNLLGDNEENLRSRALSLAGVDGIRISLWPFWVTWIPRDSKRVKIIVE
ncbi:hypothetical protein HY967_03740 [Candidatus Jorgensenbacteria bacterium]|nr:hypothetical protein [Candidatus Jorgensenbacteria bacterium]